MPTYVYMLLVASGHNPMYAPIAAYMYRIKSLRKQKKKKKKEENEEFLNASKVLLLIYYESAA